MVFVITDRNLDATDALENSTVNNVKVLGWNANNDCIQMSANTSASNLFIRSGDDCLKMWGPSVTHQERHRLAGFQWRRREFGLVRDITRRRWFDRYRRWRSEAAGWRAAQTGEDRANGCGPGLTAGYGSNVRL
jgi:hypothetical protein